MRQIVILLLLFYGTGLTAQTLRIVSGEHTGFARLAIITDDLPVWTMEQKGRTVSIIINAPNLQFDVGNIFKRIGRDRVELVSQATSDQKSEILLQLACDCTAKTFSYKGNVLVIDIADPVQTAVPDPVYDTILQAIEPSPSSPATIISPTTRTGNPVRIIPPQQPPDPVNLQNLPAGELMRSSQPTDVGQTIDNDIAPVSNLARMVEDARIKLLEKLTFAANSGLLEFEQPLVAETDTQNLAAPPFDTSTHDNILPENAMVELSSDQFNINTVYERDARESNVAPNAGLPVCPAPDKLDIANWGGGDFSQTLAGFRGRLLQEFDRPDPLATQGIVRLYIRNGFGLEALAYLKEYKGDIPDAALLGDMARIVDREQIFTGGPLESAVICGGLAGVWGLAGQRVEPTATVAKPESVLAAFSELPPDIRELLAPAISENYLRLGLPDAARRISQIVERLAGPPDAAALMDVARRAIESADLEKAISIYRALASGNSDQAINALEALAVLQLDSQIAPISGLVQDVGAAASETRGSLQAARLRRLEALLEFRVNGASSALALLDHIYKTEPSADYILGVVAEIFSNMSPVSDGLNEFVSAVDNYTYLLAVAPESDAVIISIAKNLLESGLPNMAIDLLSSLIQGGNEKALEITARADITLHNSQHALSVIENEKGLNFTLLRVHAWLDLGAFAPALEELDSQIDLGAGSVDPAWYPGDWVSAMSADAAARTIMRKYMTNNPDIGKITQLLQPVAPIGPVTLEATRSTLAQSRTVSSRLGGILANQTANNSN